MLRFLHIPKTAGMSICRAIKQPSGHRPMTDVKDEDCVSSCVRNPYDRAVSLYYFLRQKSPAYCEQFIDDDDTVNSYWAKANTLKKIPFLKSQNKWLEGAPRIDELLRFETLADDWSALAANHGLDKLTHINRSTLRPTPNWQDELTAESIAMIGELYADDFENLNYERLS